MKAFLILVVVLCATTANANTMTSLPSCLSLMLLDLNANSHSYESVLENESDILSKEVSLSNDLELHSNGRYSYPIILNNLFNGLLSVLLLSSIIYSLYRYLYKKGGSGYVFQAIGEKGLSSICSSMAESRESDDYMSKEMKVLLEKKVKEFEKKRQYLDKDISLSVLSAQFGVNSRYVSYYINQNKEKDFATYINELRINYAIYALENKPNFLRYKISYLAEQCGFASHSRFTINFKKITGVLPSDFMADIKDRKEAEKCDLM